MVSDTADILKEGMETGMKDSRGRHRKRLKYSISAKGFDVMVARIFSRQDALSEDVALASTVRSAISMGARGDIFLFDRGTSSHSNLTAILDMANKKGVTFIGRLKAGRKYMVVMDNAPAIGTSNDDVEILEDAEGYLRDSRSGKPDTSHRFRIIRLSSCASVLTTVSKKVANVRRSMRYC